MTNDRSHDVGNAKTRARLGELVNRMSDEDLARPLGEGWTIAAMLGHLAFFDARAVALIDRWEGGQPVQASPVDADAINASMLPLLLTIPVRAVVDVALRLAEQADARVAGLSGALLARIQQAGSPIKLHRSEHRAEHIEQIEQALASGQRID